MYLPYGPIFSISAIVFLREINLGTSNDSQMEIHFEEKLAKILRALQNQLRSLPRAASHFMRALCALRSELNELLISINLNPFQFDLKILLLWLNDMFVDL